MTTPAHDMESILLPVLPEHAEQISRLQTLMDGERLPIVTVIGKYNHGKSRLLNELIGSPVFEVADKRQTVQLEPFIQDGVYWLDAPGLDADVTSADDRHALHGAWLQSDLRLFVHAAKEGELDVKERALLDELLADDKVTQRQTLFVLSQIDQLTDEVELEKVMSAIRAQAPGVVLHAVSSTRYRQGLEGNKKVLLERSGVPTLQITLEQALALVHQAREHEIGMLGDQIKKELERLQTVREHALDALRRKQERLKQEFSNGLANVLNSARRQLEEA